MNEIFAPPKMPNWFWLLGRFTSSAIITYIFLDVIFDNKSLDKITKYGTFIFSVLNGLAIFFLLLIFNPLKNEEEKIEKIDDLSQIFKPSEV